MYELEPYGFSTGFCTDDELDCTGSEDVELAVLLVALEALDETGFDELELLACDDTLEDELTLLLVVLLVVLKTLDETGFDELELLTCDETLAEDDELTLLLVDVLVALEVLDETGFDELELLVCDETLAEELAVLLFSEVLDTLDILD